MKISGDLNIIDISIGTVFKFVYMDFIPCFVVI